MAWFWCFVRIWVGWNWLYESMHKINNPAWIQTGVAVKKFWEHALVIPAPPAHPPIAHEWYRAFLQFLLDNHAYGFFGKLIAWAEFSIGIALIIGAFVGLAAFAGSLMNWNFLMSGRVATNPVLLILGIGLMLAWKTAGHWGADRFLLPILGTPWQPGKIMRAGDKN